MRCIALVIALLLPAGAWSQARIVQPSPDEMVHSNAGQVPVIVADAAPGTRFRAVVDGVPVGGVHDSAAFELDGLERGAHRIAVELIGPDDRVLGRTPEVEFHVWQASRLFPARRR